MSIPLEAELEQLRSEQAQMRTLLQISRELHLARTPDDLLRAVMRASPTAVSCHLASVDLDDSGQPAWAEIVASRVSKGESSFPLYTRFYLPDFPFNRLWLAHSEETTLIPDVTQANGIDANLRQTLVAVGTLAMVIVPLTQAGRWIGVLSLGWREPQTFSSEYTALMRALPPLVAPVAAGQRLINELDDVIQQRTAELRDMREMLQLVLDAIPVRVFWKDRDLRYLGCNRMWSQDLGLESPEKAIGITDYDLASADRAEMYRADDRQVMDSGVPRIDFEETQTRPDGSTYWLRTSKVPLLDGSGSLIGVLGTYQDITAEKLAQIEREQMQQQIIAAQREALAELSTPIIPIMDRIIVMPLVGGIDTGRSRDIMRSLLDGISRYRARIAILDITGVALVDSGVADHLNRTIQAARLKGAQTIITGVSDAVAETIVDLGIDWSGVETLRDLQSGLVTALERLNMRLTRGPASDSQNHAAAQPDK